MPAVSGSTTQEATTQPDVLALESEEIDQFTDGDLAHVQSTDEFYVLDLGSTAAHSAAALWTRNSNPLFGAPAGTPGRWVLFEGTLGPAGPTGPAGTGVGNLYEYDTLVALTPIPSPGPTVLLTLPAIVAPSAGSMDVDATFGVRINLNVTTAQVGFQLETQTNGVGPWVTRASGVGAPAAGQFQSGAMSGSVAGLAAGDSVVARVSATSTLFPSAVIDPTGAGATTQHLALRARFFRA